MQQQGSPGQPRGGARDIKSMSNREIERLLGQQYAQMVKDTKTAEVIQDCEDIMRTGMDMLDKYNRIALQIKNKNFGGAFGR